MIATATRAIIDAAAWNLALAEHGTNRGFRLTSLSGRRGKQTLLDTLSNLDDHRFEDGCRTMDVGSWLRSLGLGQYEAAFRDNEIDAEVLVELTRRRPQSAWRTLRAPQAPAQGDRRVSVADKTAPPTSPRLHPRHDAPSVARSP